MAVVMVLVSGWVGLAFAVLGQILTEATFGQFFLTWMQTGLAAFFAFGMLLVLRRTLNSGTTQQA